jgi:Ca2+-binding RTX toxin-like protein
MAVTGSFFNGTLSLLGDNLDNSITASRNAAGTILINGGAVQIPGGVTPTVANTSLIQIFGQDGNDVISLDEASGALPAANVAGGAGNDTITGGSGADQLSGEDGNDTLLGKGGTDHLFGGNGDDTLTGGDADDQIFGEAGNDRMIWNPGDDTDVFEGGDGNDTAEVNGGNGDEVFSVFANGTRVRVDRLDPAPFSIDAGTTENIVIHANGGNDTITAANGLAPLVTLTIDGGTGNDTITGGDGADTLLGGDGNDVIVGGRGNDLADLGAGDDAYVFNPGDGNDVIEGRDGFDTLLFNGANVNENIAISANGARALFLRDVSAVTMDLNDVEHIQYAALGGADTITVNDMSGTDVVDVSIDLAAAPGQATGDGLVDNVIVGGTNGADVVQLIGSPGFVTAVGLATQVDVQGLDVADRLTIKGNGGDDVIIAASVPANVVALTLDGGAGDDILLGSVGADELIGGDGNDFIDGDQGNDDVSLGAGDDVFNWDPGDGNDFVDGGDGVDTVQLNGASVGEKINIVNDDGLTSLSRDVDAATIFTDKVERLDINALGGADSITLNDVGIGLTQVNVDLAGTLGGAAGDGSSDSVTINDTLAENQITVALSGGVVTVNGGAAQVTIEHAEAGDQLFINGLAGDDKINAAALTATSMGLVVDAGDGNDTVIGGAGQDVVLTGNGNDAVIGGKGDDVALLGAGDDVFTWNSGDGSDTLEGQDGTDVLDLNGASSSESFELSASGARLRLTHDIDNTILDVDGFENVSIDTLGGADKVKINDLGFTDVEQVIVDLEGTNGSATGDGAKDDVTVVGTNGDDVVVAAGNAAQLTVTGLAAQAVVEHADAGLDTLTIAMLGGDDVIEASGVTAGSIALTLNGGSGDDVAIGSAGNDAILGEDGNDSLLGGAGNDKLQGGLGTDILDGEAGSDTADYGDKTNAVLVTLNGSTSATVNVGGVAEDTVKNIENVTGGTGGDTLNGDGLVNVLVGNAGNDTLNGGGNADTLQGGVGSDTYVVDNAGDAVVEADGEGTDFVQSSVSFSIAGQFVENLTLTGSANINATGNSLSNTIVGNSGSNKLDGDKGADHMEGAAGNDTYVVDNAGDKAIETDSNGTDLVQSSVSFSIAGQFVENLTLTGSGHVNATGNSLDNTIAGNSGNNTLDGGSQGNDTLNGGAGADHMEGGTGSDTYVVDNAGDTVVEANVSGSDLVRSSVSFSLAGQFVERLTLTGSGNVNATGNSLDNVIAGNSGNNTLAGAQGADTFVFNTALNAATNLDHITDFASADTIDLENSVFTSLTTTGTLAANAFFSAAGATSAHDADDRIVYDSTTGALFFDADGAGGAAAVQFAVLDNHAALTNADFIVV